MACFAEQNKTTQHSTAQHKLARLHAPSEDEQEKLTIHARQEHQLCQARVLPLPLTVRLLPGRAFHMPDFSRCLQDSNR